MTLNSPVSGDQMPGRGGTTTLLSVEVRMVLASEAHVRVTTTVPSLGAVNT